MVGFKVLLPLGRSVDPLSIELVLVILFWALCCFELHQARTLQSPTVSSKYRYIAVILLGIYVLPLFTESLLSGSATISLSNAIEDLTTAANASSLQWEEQAAKSRTLEEAIEEYKRRYEMLPPPNFDKWHEFAVDNGSPIIDDFTQIHNDLLPFWSLEPRTIRQRTAHLTEYASLAVGLLRIRNGTVEYSPHIPGSHRWMMDSMQRMVEPFAKWLPDMDIAINLADECRMAIPFEEMRTHQVVAQKAMANMMRPGQVLQNSTTTNLNGSQWPSSFSTPLPTQVMSPFFSDNIRWQIFHDLVSPSCPPSSLARRKRWWDWSTLCVDCMLPHTILTDEGALVANVSLANDLCHQPDIAQLNGFIMTPAAMVGTNKLFPIFSQARVGGFSDIMIPSPWNFDKKSPYNESLDRTWDNKSEVLFWRGSSSDGYAAYSSWMGFLRARFVHEASQKATEQTGGQETLSINVSFAGTMSKCHQTDCATELHTFNKWANDMHIDRSAEGGSETTESLSTLITPFEDHWSYRHLIDMDGAGFSGRFLPFLKSRSLVYRAGIFRAWFDERLTAWQHYIPLDVRLGSGVWALFDFLSGEGYRSGQEHAQKVAEQGRTWARKALRPEDMQVYMFRLLLEWGRVVDDDREHLGLAS
ncbi:glycosyltransferase family 90 protein [Fusarium austroafricanum]|uniref:Glycosyltransferase family 90 protein n=1 Tax=Fusarium austroafricanum TaxID=2364996 RepID=A0A8H4NRD2_9HYPO|nr:glycosyltransferase family 90 protein [Fusarium austroafricanum]